MSPCLQQACRYNGFLFSHICEAALCDAQIFNCMLLTLTSEWDISTNIRDAFALPLISHRVLNLLLKHATTFEAWTGAKSHYSLVRCHIPLCFPVLILLHLPGPLPLQACLFSIHVDNEVAITMLILLQACLYTPRIALTTCCVCADCAPSMVPAGVHKATKALMSLGIAVSNAYRI